MVPPAQSIPEPTVVGTSAVHPRKIRTRKLVIYAVIALDVVAVGGFVAYRLTAKSNLAQQIAPQVANGKQSNGPIAPLPVTSTPASKPATQVPPPPQLSDAEVFANGNSLPSDTTAQTATQNSLDFAVRDADNALITARNSLNASE